MLKLSVAGKVPTVVVANEENEKKTREFSKLNIDIRPQANSSTKTETEKKTKQKQEIPTNQSTNKYATNGRPTADQQNQQMKRTKSQVLFCFFVSLFLISFFSFFKMQLPQLPKRQRRQQKAAVITFCLASHNSNGYL